MGKTLMIGSCEPFSGKSALVLGMLRHLRSLDIAVRFGKPLATSLELEDKKIDINQTLIDDDVRFVADTLDLRDDQLIHSIH